MKKVLFSILALSLLTGCSINIDTDKDEDKKENNNQQVENNENKEENKVTINEKYKKFVPSDEIYVKTDEKEIVVDGTKHTLAFVHSYHSSDFADEGHIRVILDEKSIWSDEPGDPLYKSMIFYETTTDELKYDKIKELEIEDYSYISTIKDSSNNGEYLYVIVREKIYESASYDTNLFIIKPNGDIIMDERFKSGSFSIEGKYKDTYDLDYNSDFATLKNNSVTIYSCEGTLEFSIVNGKTKYNNEKNLRKFEAYPSDIEMAGGC